MSGGNLDCDLYFAEIAVCDKSLVPISRREPMEYAAPLLPEGGYRNRNVTVQDISDFFVDYMKKKIRSKLQCISCIRRHQQLRCSMQRVYYSGKLASTAMDFCKTGVPAEFPRELMCTAYPSWEAN
jgi:RNA-dependent RNA polymerase